MRNNETGEFELIIGNRQLLSGFFIVVLLFAVAFAMGYVVGQNSPRSAKVSADAGTAQPASLTDAQRPAPAPATSAPQSQETAAAPPAETAPAADAPPQPTTQPAKEPDAAPPAASTTAAAQPAASNGAPARAYPAPPNAPAGSFWQVIAVPQPDVDVFYKTLKDRGFPTYVEPGTKGLMRVLVGPYNDRESMGKAKDEIEQLGFKPVRK